MTNIQDVCGRIHSFQSLGTVDGPGVRFVAFLSGCPLRCSCCHNPDTWDKDAGEPYTAAQVVERVERFREYFGEQGGITLSGGEPLCQSDFVRAIFELCHERGINTCLDTSGVFLDGRVQAALSHCDRVLLDIKYTSDELYRRHVGMPMETALRFLDYLDRQGIPTTLRQVYIPTVNDTEEDLSVLAEIARAHACVDKIELLPFRKICEMKYDKLGIPFPFADVPAADANIVAGHERRLNLKIQKLKVEN